MIQLAGPLSVFNVFRAATGIMLQVLEPLRVSHFALSTDLCTVTHGGCTVHALTVLAP